MTIGVPIAFVLAFFLAAVFPDRSITAMLIYHSR